MKRLTTLSLIGLAILALLLASCAPKPSSAPPTAQAPAPTVKAGSSSNTTATPSAADAAWAKVVADAKREGSVSIYSITFTGDIGAALTKAFQDRYGIKIDIITGRGAAFVERIKTEQRIGQVVADIVETSTNWCLTLKDAGGTVSTTDIPVLQEKNAWRVDPLAEDPEGHLLVHKYYYLSPWVNTNMIKPGQEPTSYRDLGKPQWKGQIAMSDPSVSESSYDIFVTLVNKKFLDADFVAAFGGQNIKFVPGTLDVVRAVAKGDNSVGFAASDSDAATFLADGAPIKALAMEEGSVATPSAIVRVKNDPHPNAAKVFMNWLLTTEGQTVFSKAAGLVPVRKDVQDFRSPAAAVTPKRVVVFDGQDAQNVSKAMQDKWLQNLWKR